MITDLPAASAIVDRCDYGCYCRNLPTLVVVAEPGEGLLGEDRPMCARHALTTYGVVVARIAR